MKIAATAAALIMAASAATAADLTVGGVTGSAGADFDFNYTTGADDWALEATPYVGTEFAGVAFGLATTFDVLDLNAGSTTDLFQGLDFTAGYRLNAAMDVYGEVSTDEDLNFGDVKMGVAFGF